MDSIVVISIVICTLIAYIVSCVFRYYTDEAHKYKRLFKLNEEYYSKYCALQNAVKDLISTINTKFPNSNLTYTNKDGEIIEGELKY